MSCYVSVSTTCCFAHVYWVYRNCFVRRLPDGLKLWNETGLRSRTPTFQDLAISSDEELFMVAPEVGNLNVTNVIHRGLTSYFVKDEAVIANIRARKLIGIWIITRRAGQREDAVMLILPPVKA